MRFFLVGNITQKWIAGPAVQGNRVLQRHRRKLPEKTVSGPKRSFGPDTVFSGDSSMPSAEDAIALRQSAEGRSRKSEVRRQSEVGRKLESGRRRQKAVGRKLEAGRRRQRAVGTRSEQKVGGRRRQEAESKGQGEEGRRLSA